MLIASPYTEVADLQCLSRIFPLEKRINSIRSRNMIRPISHSGTFIRSVLISQIYVNIDAREMKYGGHDAFFSTEPFD